MSVYILTDNKCFVMKELVGATNCKEKKKSGYYFYNILEPAGVNVTQDYH